MNKNLIDDLAQIIINRKKLEAEEKVLKAALLEEMQKDKEDKYPTEFGTFSVARRARHIYTDAVKDAELKLKMQKDKEEKQGKTTVEITEYLMFK